MRWEEILSLKTYNYSKSMAEENINLEFWLKNMYKARSYFLEEIEQNELMSKKQKKVFATPNYVKNFIISASAVTWCILISVFASLVGIPIGITSSEARLKNCPNSNSFSRCSFLRRYKMNEIVNKFLLAGDKFMAEMRLRQPAALVKPGFIYSACRQFAKNNTKIQRNRRLKIYLLKETR